jgi:glycosyltransferase involved in cell wall biosynthesis
MRVLLISNYKPDNQRSMLGYTRFLKHELQTRGISVEIAYPPVILGGLPFLPGPFKKWIGYIDKYLFAPAYLRKEAAQADIIHVCDHSNAMYLQCAEERPALITCHDTIAIFAARGAYPGVKVGLTGRIQQRWIASNLLGAKHIISVSNKTQDDLELLAPGIHSRTTVIHHHLNWNYFPASPEAIAEAKSNCGLDPETRYLLHLGGNSWYKNRSGAIQIFAALRKYSEFQSVKLVLAGKRLSSQMRQHCKASGFENEIIERLEISNEELRALYSGAMALLFPSREEGFGWPILEAQACGCPVITSNRPPMTEIAGEGAVFIDPGAPEEAARTIVEHTSNFPALRMAGFRNLARFEKTRMIDSYVKCYEQALGKETTKEAGQEESVKSHSLT